MIDVEEILRDRLPALYETDAREDWDSIVAGSGLRNQHQRRRLAVVAAGVVAVVIVGTAIAASFGGFGPWLTGEPGKPASPAQQQAFARATAHSWLAFPKGTQLRQLITQRVGGATVDLLGFRSGTSSLCIRLTINGHASNIATQCAPLSDLRLSGAPVRVMVIDQTVGKGPHVAWYGLDKVHSAAFQITAGVAADGVTTVVLRDQRGRHIVPTHANAFLYVAKAPVIFQRVNAVWARTASGLVTVPFSPSPVGFGFGAAASRPAPAVHIERKVAGGRIGWLDSHRNVGQPLSALPPRIRRDLLGGRLGRIVFGRVIAPDPGMPFRIAVTLNAHRRGGPPAGLCTMSVGVNGGGTGGCSPYPGLFARSLISVTSSASGSGEFEQAQGVVSDSVTRLSALLANGQRLAVPLVDNAYVIGLPRAELPARLVAYGSDGKVIGASDAIGDIVGSTVSPARGRAVLLLHVLGTNGAHAELLVGPATDGGECLYVKHYVSPTVAGVMEGCQGRVWSGSALRLSADPNFVSGRVRSDVAEVKLHFASGAEEALTPTKGYVLFAIPPGRKLVSADGVSGTGKALGHMSFLPPKRGG